MQPWLSLLMIPMPHFQKRRDDSKNIMFPCPLYFLQIGSWNQGFDYYHSNKTIAGGLFFYQEACNALLFFYIHFKINFYK